MTRNREDLTTIYLPPEFLVEVLDAAVLQFASAAAERDACGDWRKALELGAKIRKARQIIKELSSAPSPVAKRQSTSSPVTSRKRRPASRFWRAFRECLAGGLAGLFLTLLILAEIMVAKLFLPANLQ